MSTGAWIILCAMLLVGAFQVWRSRSDGRFGGEGSAEVTPHGEGLANQPAPIGAELVSAAGRVLGERATLLQFSSAFCAPCRTTRRVLEEVAGIVDGVTHVEIDADMHLSATRSFDVMRTPTTVVLDAEGTEVTRAVGAPSREQVFTALALV